ncbi:acyl-CoA thioesterase [Alkalihalobacillus sp. MEB130]|uniref:acyl-CoA thioesterase n=1 Tax=Alkalihalobacillus sp. MEB130 TaxID=2976704 RepID=UPI0028E00EFD|nr:thioesterase family protein [Alkalihalobacillus sp. MEB130]MDT8859470.1 acyl-CoA thioesterase [Alkalihalobacillus sp. MEB130]
MKRPSYIDNVEMWKESFDFFIEIKVRFCETDAFGHVNNTNAFVYFEEARLEWFKQKGMMKKWASKSNDAIIVTADLQCDYHRQILFDDRLQVGVKVAHIGRSSIDLHYLAVTSTGDVCLTGRGTMVQVSKETGRGLPFDQETKELLSI